MYTGTIIKLQTTAIALNTKRVAHVKNITMRKNTYYSRKLAHARIDTIRLARAVDILNDPFYA